MKTILIITGTLLLAATIPAQETNLAIIVRHAPSLNGGQIQGSLQELNGENVTVNGGFAMTGDLLVPGTPTLVLNGHPAYTGTIAGSGRASPSGYQITLNGNCSLNHLRTQTEPVSLPTVSSPPMPAGARSVSINRAGQSYGDSTTLCNLTLNGNVGPVSVPPGTYGNFAVGSGSSLVLGVAGGLQAVNYNLQNLTLNGNPSLKVVGPVVLTVANGFAANGAVGASNHPAWLQLRVASGGFTLNSGCTVYGLVTAPSGTVIVNAGTTLVGASASDQFILNGGGLVQWSSSSMQTNRPPVATNQTITLAENSSANITLTGLDPQGLALTFSLLTQPAHGTLSGTPPKVTYRPATNYFGSDAFTFKVNNGITDSVPATISLIVTQVYYPPLAYSQKLTNFEDTLLPVTLTGSDPQGYALTYSILTQPAHGNLIGIAPNLIYLPATNYFGNDPFTFLVNDGVSNSAAATVSITNKPVDDSPVVVAGPDQLIVLPTNTARLLGSVTYDVFPGTADTILWSEVSGPGDVTFSNPTNTTAIATFSTNGVYCLRLFASDSFLSGSNDLYVTVDAPPAIYAGATMTNTFPGTVTLPGTASDDGLPTNGTLTILWTVASGPGTVIFENPSATNSAATFSTNGIYTLRLTADDGAATNSSDVTVIENLPPAVNAGTSILTNGLQAILNGSVSDDGLPGSFLSVEWSQSSGPGTVVFGNAQETNTTVAASQSGTYVLTLTAFDGAATNSGEVVVTFNLPPDVNAGPEQTVNLGDTVKLAGTATDDQLPYNILNTIWMQVNGPGTAAFADATLTNTTVNFDQAGVYTLRLSATDTLATNRADVFIRVNAAPVVNAGANQTVPFGTQVVLVGSDVDDGIPGLTVTTLWTQISGPVAAVFTDPTLTNTAVRFSQSGDYVFQLTADDGMTNSSAQVTITVMPAPAVNHAPVAQSQALNTITNTSLNITLSATDADNDPLTFQVVTGPVNGTLSGNAPNLIYQPSVGFIGTDSFTFVANDGQTDSAPATVTIHVQAPANSLQLIVPEAQEVLQDTPFTFVDEKRIAIEGGTTGGSSLLLSLSVTNGTLTLGSTNGLAVISGADGTSNLVVSGSQNDLNTALDGLSYLGNPYFVGTDIIMAMVEQTGGSGASDSKIVPITVLPILTDVGPLTGAIEQFPFVITYDDMYWNSDIGDGVSFLVESLTTGDLTKNGNPLEYGTTLISPGDSVVWTPPAGAIGVTDAFHVRAWDGTHLSSKDVPVYVNVKTFTKPHLNVPGDQVIPYDMPLVFDSRRPISITDDLSLGALELSLTVSNGALTLNPVDGLEWQVGANGSSHQVIRGTLANLNAALSGLSYFNTFNFLGNDRLQVTMDDLGNNGLGVDFTDAKNVAITVLAPPNSPPQLSIINPLDASQVQSGQAITIEVSALDSDGQITNVTLFADGSEIASLTGPPFVATWTGVILGKHVLSASATDNRGATSVSTSVSIWVVDENGDFIVDAGPDQVISLPDSAILTGNVEISMLVAGNQTNMTWIQLDGPGDAQFSTPNALHTSAKFSQPGTYIIRWQVEYASLTRSDLVRVDVLPPPPSRLTAARSSQGTDFWLTKMYRDFSSSDASFDWYILIAAETNADVRIVSPQYDLINTTTNVLQVKAGTIRTIAVGDPGDSFFWDTISGIVKNDSVHVIADAPVTVYGFIRDSYSADGYLALPTSFLGTNYMVMSYDGASGFAIAATEDDTTVTMVPTSDIDENRLAGQPCQIVMQRGQTFRTEKLWDGDFTGTTVVSDKPIAVFGGGVGAYVPTNYPYSDYLIEQMTPINTWGQHFATMPLATRLNGDTFRFLASEDGTKISVNGKVVADLNRGQFYEHIITDPSIILSTHPILVGQFANGTTFDGIMGDPFMMLVPPVEQFGGTYLLEATSLNGIRYFWEDPNLDYVSYMNLIVFGNPTNTVLLNDTPVPADQFQRIGDSEYFGAQLAVSNAAYRISSPAPVGVCVYGWAPCESYAFSGGIYSESVEPDTKFELTQATPFAAVGHEKTVYVHVANGRGLPLSDLNVSFSVSGANAAEGKAMISHLGEGVFSYTGTNAGEDIITASVADLQQSVTNTWITGSDNTAPMVSTAGTQPLQLSHTIELVGAVSDDNRPMGGQLHIQWRLFSGLAAVQFQDSAQPLTQALCPQSGTYVFELTADDSQFSSDSLVTVVVDDPPIIGFPPDNSQIPSVIPGGQPFRLMANASDDDGLIDRVEFYGNGHLLGIATNWDWSTGYSINWTPPTNGWVQFQAIAYDNLGASNSLDLGRTWVDFPPQVSIDSPGNGDVLTVPTNVLIRASASDPDGTIVSLGIYANGQLLAMTNGPDLAIAWFPQYQGSFDLTAVAQDNLGLAITSAVIFVTVTGDFPQVTIINNYTNQWGSAFIRIPFGEPALLQAEVWLSGPHQITNVDFYVEDSYGQNGLIGSLSQPPYQIVWTPQEGTDAGFINVVAEADSGAIGEGTGFFECYRDVSIAFASPTPGQTVVVGMPVPLQLTVADPGQIMGIYDYYVNGQLLVEATNSAPVIWQPPAAGNYQISVQAYDLYYGKSASPFTANTMVTAVNLSIENVVIVSPTDGEKSYAGASLPIAVEFADSAGIFDHLEVFTNGVSLGTATNAIFYWTPTQTNDYTLTATVFDVLSNTYTAANSVTVHIVTPPRPVITITAPADGRRVQANAVTMLTASLNDPASLVTNVQFYVDDVKVSDNTTSYGWTPTQLGGHVLQAVALTSDNDSITSAPVNVTVAVMYPPVVTLLSPTNEQRFPSDQQPLLLAQATDADGVISNLSLSLDSTALGNTNGALLEILVTNVAPGWHDAVARATDNDGLSSSSDSVSFYVERREDLTLPVPDQLTAEAISATEIQLAWQPVSTNERAQSILIERWDVTQSLWIEIGETAVANFSYTDSNLDPETNYRYRIACVNTNGVRSAYSAEAGATTRTVVPNYTAIDLSQAIAASLTNLPTGANILTNAGLANFDGRRTAPLDAQHVYAVLGTNAVPLLQAAARFKEQWPQIQLDFDPVLLSPKSILPRLGFLTGPNGSGVTVSDTTAQMFDPNDPYRAVKAFVQEYQDLFGFGPKAITNALVERDYISPATGTHTVVWQQQVAGIPVFDTLLIGNITANGELASVACEFIPAPTNAVDASAVALVLAENPLPVSGSQAVLTAVTNVGDLFSPGDFNTQTDSQGIVRSQSFTAIRGFKQSASVELTWFPASRNELKLAWQVIFTSQWRGEMYLTVVSALDGQILYRRNLTADNSEASYRVYTDASPAPMWPGLPAPGTAQAAFVDRSLLTFSALDTNASPNGWINDADNETRGNNVDAHLDRDDDNNADLPRPTGNPWRVFDFTLDPASNPDSYGDAAVVQLFFWDNWMHDALYELGFTEAAGNFQDDDFGRGGFGGDAVQADAQDGFFLNDGQHHNNANMSTPPDGYAPRMQMYVFDGATPARDGSLDAEIILHEYTHGLSSRLVGGGAGIDALQTAGLGEGWSDFYALSLLANPTNDVNATYPVGGYVAYHAFGSTFEQNYYYGIRHYPYCTDTNKNPLTFTDIDPSRALPYPGVPRSPLLGAFSAAQASEVHNQGEVWCSMLWELRANLINQYGPVPGNNLALQLVTDGMKLSPANPNFVQARDAVLLADRIYSGGANASEIWGAFAKRGLGFDAKAPESYTTSGVRDSHDLQPALAAERIEIQSVSGSVELGANNGLLIHLRNQGNATATRVSGHLSTAGPGVSVVQNDATYTDIPPGAENVNAVAFQMLTGNDYISGTPIDLELIITADQGASTNYLRLFTGVPGAEILFDDYNALAEPMSASPAPADLTPWDLGNAEPLWMADDASCLLKAGDGKYILWKPGGTVQAIVNTNFLAHRLTHNGIVVGTLNLPNEAVTGCATITNAQNIVTIICWTNIIPHSVGAWWNFTTGTPVPLTAPQYQWPAGTAPFQPSGATYSAVVPDQSGNAAFLTNIFAYPALQDVWDMNGNGVAVGAASFQGAFHELMYFDTAGDLDWFTPTERGLDAGQGGNNYWTVVDFLALTTSAAQFNSPDNWRWLGPLNWQTPTSYASLINDAGMVAGAAAVDLNDPNLNAQRPTHAFRAPLSGECQPFATIITDLGALPGGWHSFPRAMNAAGDLVGYSDFDAMSTGGLNSSPFNSHAVYWGLTNTVPEWLANYPPSATAPYGYADAYGINDSNQIVGASILANGQMAGVTWQWNNNTNGDPFWEITDLNDRLTDSSWQVFRAVDINNDGLILAHAFDASGIKHAVLLVPMAMAVDNNRDGNITFDDADKTTADKPYRFWVNNDYDGYDSSIDDYADLDPSQGDDASNLAISCKRDLEDYTRLWIDTKGIVTELLDGKLLLALEWKNATDDPRMQFFLAAETNGGALYLTDTNIAAQQVNVHGMHIIEWAHRNVLTKYNPFIFPQSFWTAANISPEQPVAHLLFDAVSRGSGQLVISIYKNDGITKLAESGPLYLKLQDVKEMYQRWTVDNNGAAAATATTMNLPYPYDSTIPAENNFILFVHGWNLAPWERDAFADTAFKRLYWQGYKGHFGAFQWPTGYGFGGGAWDVLTDPRNFDNSESNAWASATGLLGMLKDLNGQYPNHVYLMAHSMGNIVAGEALKLAGSSQVVNTYIAVQAAVAAHTYDPSCATHSFNYLGINQDSGTPNRFAEYWTNGASCYFHDINGAGTFVNFYNVSDYALDKWIVDQDFKPDKSLSGHTAYGYAPENGFYKISGTVTDYLGFPTNTYEIFAYADEARSFALGATKDVAGTFTGAQLDLQTIWPPDDSSTDLSQKYKAHKWHSAEFNFDNMQQNTFWNTLLGPLGFNLR